MSNSRASHKKRASDDSGRSNDTLSHLASVVEEDLLRDGESLKPISTLDETSKSEEGLLSRHPSPDTTVKCKKLPDEFLKNNQTLIISQSRHMALLSDVKKSQTASKKESIFQGVNKSIVNATNRGTQPETNSELGRRKFSDAEELILKKIILQSATANNGYDKQQIKDVATEMYQKRMNDPEAKVGEAWFKGFMSRNFDLKYNCGRVVNHGRIKAQKSQINMKWRELVRESIQKYHINPRDVYNFDESGFLLGVSFKTKIVTSIEILENPSTVTHDENELITENELVTVIECIGSAGQVLARYIIFKSEYLMDSWFANLKDQEDWRFDYSPEGCTNNDIAVRWLTKTFVPQAVTRKGEYALLVFDGHPTHFSQQFCDVCEQHKIINLCVPSKLSQRLQPLSAGCFPVLRAAWRNLNRKRSRYCQSFIGQEGFIPLYYKARLQTFTEENIKNSFSKAGLSPIYPQ